MSTESNQPELAATASAIVAPTIPSFAGFAVRTSDSAIADISPAEAALLHPRAVPGRRETFRLGRQAAHAAMQAIGQDGGPVLAGTSREPIWPTGLVGSISHVAGVGVALVAPAELSDGIGIDIESQRWAPELEDQVPRPEEREWLDSGSTTERSANLLALFSAKESVFKAFYPNVGRYFGFAAASLVPTSSGFAASLVEEIDDRYPATRSFNISCQWFGTTVMTWLVLPKTP